MRRTVVLLVLLCLVRRISGDSCSALRTSWYDQKVGSGCLDESLAVHHLGSRQTLQECLLKVTTAAGSSTTSLVAQYHPDGGCSVFAYPTVCRAFLEASGRSGGCRLLANSAARPQVEYHLRVGEKLQGIWSLNSDAVRSVVNVACGPSATWQVGGSVTWTEQGVWLNAGSLTLFSFAVGDQALGLTWLLRCRRNPGAQLLLANMNNDNQLGPYLYEYNNRPVVFNTQDLASTMYRFESGVNFLPASSSEFFDFAVTGSVSAGHFSFYLDGAMTSATAVTVGSVATPRQKFKYGIGYYVNGFLSSTHGTFRVIAMANGTLSLEEIRQFFLNVT